MGLMPCYVKRSSMPAHLQVDKPASTKDGDRPEHLVNEKRPDACLHRRGRRTKKAQAMRRSATSGYSTAAGSLARDSSAIASPGEPRPPQLPRDEAAGDVLRQAVVAPVVAHQCASDQFRVLARTERQSGSHDVAPMPVSRQLAHEGRERQNQGSLMPGAAVFEEPLQHEVAVVVAGERRRASDELVGEEGDLLGQAIFEQPLEDTRPLLVLRRGDGTAAELRGDEARAGGRGRRGDEFLQHVVSMGRGGDGPDVAPEPGDDGLLKVRGRRRDGELQEARAALGRGERQRRPCDAFQVADVKSRRRGAHDARHLTDLAATVEMGARHDAPTHGSAGREQRQHRAPEDPGGLDL
mmetsp:Transcript_110729/g.319890  ORF Transcript_110729/g.319890 Transcript_110729/m.319890 type:complete len:353 (+) Transcript_110729:152-1210(+)